MKKIILVLLCLLLISCNKETYTDVKDVDENGLETLILALDQADINYEEADVISDLLRGNNVNYQIYDGQILQIYVYDDVEMLEVDVKSISPSGSSITYEDDKGESIHSTEISWIERPHFFLYKNLIILYVGSHQETLSFLDGIKDAKLNH